MELRSPAGVTLKGHPITNNGLTPPLVSVVVINRNYADYIGAAIDSIRRQDYAWFECFVVDNASTDDSHTVISRHIGDDPRFSVIKLDRNFGPLGATLRIFDRITGNFVVFVDSDDLLFANFLSSHVQVHLGLPNAVSFTSSNIVDIDAQGRLLTGGRVGFGAEFASQLSATSLSSTAPRLSTILDEEYASLGAATITIPHWKTHWVWGPGSANVYRKSALDLVVPVDCEAIADHAGDAYFIPMLHLMTGSALIFQQLSAYRVHGRNLFSSSPLLQAIRTERNYPARRGSIQRLQVLRTFVARAESFNWILAGNRFWSTLDLLCQIDGETPCIYFAREDVRNVLAEAWFPLLQTFGTETLLAALRARMGANNLWRLIATAYRGRPPIALRAQFAKRELRRHLSATRPKNIAILS